MSNTRGSRTELLRVLFEAGVSSIEIEQCFGVTRGNVYRRAQRGGWRRDGKRVALVDGVRSLVPKSLEHLSAAIADACACDDQATASLILELMRGHDDTVTRPPRKGAAAPDD